MLLFLSFLPIDNDVLFRGPQRIDFKQTSISDLIFVGLYINRKFKNENACSEVNFLQLYLWYNFFL